jgi:hypothetical protein
VEIRATTETTAQTEWCEFSDWDRRFWEHHSLFQKAVNYYTLCFAGMASAVDSSIPEGKALARWRDQVEESWEQGVRRAIRFEGPHRGICEVLGLDSEQAKFRDCIKAALKRSNATKEQMSAALTQLLKEADKGDLNQLCVGRLPWFASPKGKFDGTSKSVAQGQEAKMLSAIKRLHEAKVSELSTFKLDPGLFLTQPPSEFLTGEEARCEVLRVLDKAGKKDENVAALKKDFSAYLEKNLKQLRIPSPGRRPKGVYPYALFFAVWPSRATGELLKEQTKSLKDRPLPVIESDAIASARVDDNPLFEYFTNRAFYRGQDDKNRAVWFEFDLAAFIEAIKSPHRYFQDTLVREQEAERLRKNIALIEGEGGQTDKEDEENYFGFKGDHRIVLIRKLVTSVLACEVGESGSSEKTEYSVSERTLRGWREIRRKWREEARKGEISRQRLIDIVNAEQTDHRDDFGSAALFRNLAEPEFQPIWRDAGPQPHNPDDPLDAWRIYKEIIEDLNDTERPIRFTPAHPIHSPRFFIFPHKQKAGGKFGSEHSVKDLSFTSGIAIKTQRGWEPVNVRINYSAPRLRRDEVFDENSEDGKWLQPMMKALGLPEPDDVDLRATRIILNVTNRGEGINCQLSFPVAIEPERLQQAVGKKERWDKQFNMRPDGDNFREASLKWPHEKPAKTPPGWKPWHKGLSEFRVISVDLGQRDAGGYALLRACSSGRTKKPSRFLGEAEGTAWRAELVSTGLFRLPGEDAIVWRDSSPKEGSKGETGFAFRQELWGDRGRPALAEETKDAVDLVKSLSLSVEDFFRDNRPSMLSFPEQNDELLRAARRAQSVCARLHRWAWMLNDAKLGKNVEDVFAEILEGEEKEFQNVREAAEKKQKEKALALISTELSGRLDILPTVLVKMANRVVPLRGRSWKWEKHPQAPNSFLLDQTGDALPKTLIRGQRGLSFRRIEQIEELRRRFQSLNQLLRREVGAPAPKQRDETVPDPCPDLLEKLDRLKRQRVNQTAHMILAEALGLKLSKPPEDKSRLWNEFDLHGTYEKKREPVDFIVIEDLSRYRASQGRAPRENSRLMKWCHRSVRDKLRELTEPFGIPVLETTAAYSSRFCSRSGVPGFRAVEVNEAMAIEPQWARKLAAWVEHQKPNGKKLASDAIEEHQNISDVFEQLRTGGRFSTTSVPGTLLLPKNMGPLFVPFVAQCKGADIQPALAQADINAAINLALRAIADPRLWSIQPRIRTERAKASKKLLAKEKRKYGERIQPEVSIVGKATSELDESKHPNFFFDVSNTINWGIAEVSDPLTHRPRPVIWSKAFWGEVKRRQWQRIQEINKQRIAAWKKKADEADRIPM